MLSEDYVDSLCEIKTMKNVLLVTGRIRKVGFGEIEIYDPPNQMPILVIDTPIKLIVHNSGLGMQVLTGRVYISNRRFLRAVDVLSFADYEKRRYFRLDIDHSASILMPKEQETGEEAGGETEETGDLFRVSIDRPADLLLPIAGGHGGHEQAGEQAEHTWEEVPIRVRNISLCGLLFQSSMEFQVGKRLRLRMALFNNNEELLDVVIRRITTMDDGSEGYGSELLDVPDRVEQNLCAFLFREQQEQIRRSRRQ